MVNGASVVPQQSAQLSRAKPFCVNEADVVPHRQPDTRLAHESCHVHWRNSFMSRVNQTGALKGPDLRNKFRLGSFFDFFKKRDKIQKKITKPDVATSTDQQGTFHWTNFLLAPIKSLSFL
jgi:hypothetical protein